jgi:hypothetical protein
VATAHATIAHWRQYSLTLRIKAELWFRRSHYGQYSGLLVASVAPKSQLAAKQSCFTVYFFSLQNVHNFEAVAKTKLFAGLVLRSAWQGFWLSKPNSDSWYNAGAVRTAMSPVSSHVGDEVDITLIYKIPGYKVKVIAGYSHFFTGNYIKQTGASKDADFVFIQAKMSF